MWPFEDELKLWFEEVEQRRSADTPSDSSSGQEAPMMGNELAHEMKHGAKS